MSWFERAARIPRPLTEVIFGKPKASYRKILKEGVGNPYHDEQGRFTHGPGGASITDDVRSKPGAGKVEPTADGTPPKDKPVTLMFGGTFNPIHSGHIDTIERAKKWMEAQGYKVERVVLSPSGDSLAKAKAEKKGDPSEFTTADDRAEMIRSAVKDHPGLEVSTGPAHDADNYTGKLRRTQLADWGATKYPGTTVINVTGADEAPGHPPGFPSVYMGDAGSNHEGYAYMALPREEGSISSTKIRNAMKEGKPVPEGWLHPEVEKRYRQLKGKVTKSYLHILKWDPEKHPRAPAGSPEGGQFTSGDGGTADGGKEDKGGSNSDEQFNSEEHISSRGMKGTPVYDDDFHLPTYFNRFNQRISDDDAIGTLPPEGQAEYRVKKAALEAEILSGNSTKDRNLLPDGKTYTPERKKLHNEIVDEFFKDWRNYLPPDGERPEVVVLGGFGGSGKSKFGGAIGAYDANKYLRIDPDEFKKLLGDKIGMDLTHAALLHKESSDLKDMALARARALGINFVLDGTMSGGSATRVLRDAKDPKTGVEYKTAAHFMFVTEKEAKIRALSRWWDDETGKGKGRLVLLSTVDEQKNNVDNFDSIVKEGLADTWSVFSNMRGTKKDPSIKLAEKGRKGRKGAFV